MRLAGTTKTTIAAIRDRTHWNSAALTPLDPVTLGLCSQIDLDFEVQRSAKDRPAVVDQGPTLIPAEETTQPFYYQPTSQEEVFGSSSSKAPVEEEDEIDVDSVFAKLKDLKTKE